MNPTTIIREPLPLLPRFSVAPEAEERRNELILAVRQFPAVTNQTQANSLSEAARDLRTYIATVKKQNLEWRRPVNDALAQAMAVEKDHLAPAQTELDAAERVAGAWHAAEQRRVAEVERVRQAELRRLMAAEEEARRLATASDAPEDIKAAKELYDAATASVEAALYAPKPEAVRVGGMTTKRVMKVEVTDLHALYKAAPHLVRLEANLAAIKATCFPEQPMPGLRLSYEETTTTRRW